MAPPSPLLPTHGRRALRGRRSAAQEATCRREPARVGDVFVLENPWETVQGEYQVISVSDHFQVVAPRYALAYYPPSRRARAEGFAAEVEERAYPLLARVFREWPDTEGDGRLTLILSDGMSAAGGGLIARYADGCDGDFITMGNELLDSAADAESNNAVGVFVHEATHWYDRFDYGDNGLWHPEWSVEAVASLVERLWMWELKRRGFWEQAPLACPAGASCALHMMQEDRYGWPGLSHDGGYGHGLHILHYLVQQAVPQGAEPHDAIGKLPDRLTVQGDLRLTPVFRALGGTGRTEEELQGEYLLSFYADGHVEGASARILQPSWDLPAVNPSYPLRHFVLSTTEPAATAALARPDGIVFEVVAEPGSALFVTPATHRITLALVRRD